MNIKNKIKEEIKDYKLLLRNIPSMVIAMFVLSTVAMNLLANKELINYGYLALDCGFTLSWISFLCMDIICKRFGPKASTKISILALIVNLTLTIIFALLMKTPGNWSVFYNYIDSDYQAAINANQALNSVFSGTWYVVIGSSVAMLVSAIVNSFLNHIIGKLIKDNNSGITYKKFAIRSFISTGIAQFVDNLVFALLVSYIFFQWTIIQVLICSLIGAVMELLCEIIFSPLGFRVAKNWEKENIGKEYLSYITNKDKGNE